MSFVCLLVLFFTLAELSYSNGSMIYLFIADRLDIIALVLMFTMFMSMAGLAVTEYLNKRS